MMQKVKPDFYIHIGIKNDRVVETDWAEMLPHEKVNMNNGDRSKAVIGYLQQAIKTIDASPVTSLLIIILLIVVPFASHAQTLLQEYTLKQEYKKADISLDKENCTLTAFGKAYRIETSYFDLRFTVMENGDYICILGGSGCWEYLEQIERREKRYKVCYRGGYRKINASGQVTEYRPSIWILRKQTK